MEPDVFRCFENVHFVPFIMPPTSSPKGAGINQGKNDSAILSSSIEKML